MSESQIDTLWITAKADLATVSATFATMQGQLQTLEADCVQLAAAGGGDVVQWIHTQVRQLSAGYALYPTPGVAAVVPVFAPDPNSPRQLSILGDQRPISAIHPGLT
jgi:hypothetical protein